jgi:two-component system phosphate regulon response regulator PhoB
MHAGGQRLSADTPGHVLVVDDEESLRQLVAFNLTQAGFSVTEAGTGRDAFAAARTVAPDAMVLDVMLPDTSGLVVCSIVRHDPDLRDTSVLLLSACGAERDRLAGLAAGADDYVVKPFSVRELVHRVRRLARWTHERRMARRLPSQPPPTEETSRWLEWRGLRVDVLRHRVQIDDADVELRPIEFRLIAMFLSNPNRVLTRSELMMEIWGGERPESRTVDTWISRLRERLGRYEGAVETVSGFGYRLGNPSRG